MTPDRWQLIKALFAAALEIEAPEREHWLDGQCQGDATLRTEVESLLAAHAAPIDVLDSPAKNRAGLEGLNLVEVLKEQQAIESLQRRPRRTPDDE